MVHGVVFIAYCLVTLVVAIDQRWSPGRTVLGLAAAVPPFATLLFEAYADRRGLLGPEWLSRHDSPTARSAPCAGCCATTGWPRVCSWAPSPGSPRLALLVGPPA